MNKKQTNQQVNYDFTITNIRFPTIEDSKFRLISAANTDQTAISIKIEKLKSSQQWELEVADIAKHGLAGIPKPTIIKALKQAIDQLVEYDDIPRDKVKGDTADVSFIEADMEGEGALSLTLYVPFVDIHIDYQFKFLPVGRELTDILETQLRDAEEEIEALKKEMRKLKETHVLKQEFICLRSSTNVKAGLVTWNHLERNSSPTTYQLSANNQDVTVLSKGWYQVSCRITGPDTSGTRYVAIRRNDADVSLAYNGSNKGYNKSVSICDFMSFEANDKLSVFYQSSHFNQHEETCNYLSLQKVMEDAYNGFEDLAEKDVKNKVLEEGNSEQAKGKHTEAASNFMNGDETNLFGPAHLSDY